MSPILSIGLSIIKNALTNAPPAGAGGGGEGGGVSILTYITDKLKLYFNFAKESESDVEILGDNAAYTGHKTVQFGSAGSTSFDGTDDEIAITSSGTLSDWTWATWAKADFTDNAWHIFYNQAVDYEETAGSRITIAIESNVFKMYDNGYRNSGYTLSDTNWHYYTITQRGTDLNLYVDGEFHGNVTSNGTKLGGDAFMGRYSLSVIELWEGSMANMGIWTRVLSQNEIQAVMRKSYSDLGTAEKQSLEAWWGLDSAATSPTVKMDVGTLGTIVLYAGSGDEMGKGENEKTAVFWMKWDGSNGGANGSGLSSGSGNWMAYFRITVNGSIAHYDGTYRASDADAVKAGQWHMITLTESVSGGNHSMYIDNVLIRTDSGSTSVSNQWTAMGSYSGRNYGGQFASAAYYDKVLSLSEVQSLYALGRYGDMNTVSNCENFWKFDSVTSITAEVGDLDISSFTACSLSTETTESVGNDLSAKNNGEINGTTTTVSIYGGHAPKLARTIDVAVETLADAIGGGSYEFNGASDNIVIDHSSSLNISSNLTITVWVKPDGASASGYVVAKTDYSSTGGWSIFWNGGSNLIANFYGGGESRSSSAVFTDNSNWVHVAHTVTSGGAWEFFRNGVSAGSGTSLSLAANVLDVRVGTKSNAADSFFEGSVSQVGMWSRVLTDAEIVSVMEKTYSDLAVTEKVDLEGWLGLDTAFINQVVAMDSGSNGSISLSSASGELGEGESQKSMVIWLKWDGVNTSLSQITSGSGTSWCNYWLANGGKLGWYDPGDSYVYSGAGTIVTGQWHMAVLAADVSTTTTKQYIDNALTATGTNQTSLSTAAQCIGLAGYNGREWGGQFASAAYYDKVLTLSEVQSLYALGKFGDMTTVANANLQNWWKFDNVTSVADLKGSITITSFTNTVISGETTESVSENHGVLG